jgi:hypothetical protein
MTGFSSKTAVSSRARFCGLRALRRGRADPSRQGADAPPPNGVIMAAISGRHTGKGVDMVTGGRGAGATFAESASRAPRSACPLSRHTASRREACLGDVLTTARHRGRRTSSSWGRKSVTEAP